MRMFSPGRRVTWYLPRRSTIHSSPCATRRTPLAIVTSTKTRTATAMIRPSDMNTPLKADQSGLRHLDEAAFHTEHLHPLAGGDLAVGHAGPFLRAQDGTLETHPATLEGRHRSHQQADLADHLAGRG